MGCGSDQCLALLFFLGPDLTEAKTTFEIFFQFNQFCTQAVGLTSVGLFYIFSSSISFPKQVCKLYKVKVYMLGHCAKIKPALNSNVSIVRAGLA